MFVICICITMIMVSTCKVSAMTEVNVEYDFYSHVYETDSILGELGGVKLNMPVNHRDMRVTLVTQQSIARELETGNSIASPFLALIIRLIDDASSALNGLPPGMVSNNYFVNFYDYQGTRVYTGVLSNGGSEELFIGSNVSYIVVWSWYDTDPLLTQPISKGCVHYENGYELS